MTKKPITVYWSPSVPDPNNDSYDIDDFNDPIPLRYTIKSQIIDPYFYQCPAIKDVSRQVYAVTFKINESSTINPKALKEYYDNDANSLESQPKEWLPISEDNPLLTCNRNSSLENHVNVNYGRSWIFFADEPVVAKFTSPWLPPVSPAPGDMVVPGKYDIGRWFRDFHVDYFVPLGTTSWTYTDKDPIFYIELETDREVVFKRFDIRHSLKLEEIAEECMLTSRNTKKPYGLLKRYDDFKQKGYISTMLSELAIITK